MAKRRTNVTPGIARILIIDQYPIIRAGLAMLIDQQSDMTVCGATADVVEALRLVAATKPDLAIIDGALKTGSGIELIKRIKSHNDTVRMLAWSTYTETHFAERALRAGAMGYMAKDQATDEIIQAIRRVLDGKVFLSEIISDRLLHRVVGKEREIPDQTSVETLSDRELEVFQLLGQGLDRNEIAAQMRVSAKTVETYRARVKEKLHLRRATELLRRAVEWRLENH